MTLNAFSSGQRLTHIRQSLLLKCDLRNNEAALVPNSEDTASGILAAKTISIMTKTDIPRTFFLVRISRTTTAINIKNNA